MRRPTINDVAADCGVSRATVSLVLRDSPQIPPSTKERVRESMARLGYVYNRRAADMRNQRTRILGLVVTNVRNPYFAELTMAIEQAAHDAGFTLFLGCSWDDAARQRRLLATMAEHRIDGLVLLPAVATSPEDMRDTVGAAGIPHVLVARSIRGYSVDYVGADNVRAGRMVGEHLAQLNVGSVAFLGGPKDSSAYRDRLDGLDTALEAAGLPPAGQMAFPADGYNGIAELVGVLLEDGAPPDAIVAYNDLAAFDVLQALRARSLEPGRDVAVASFDNVPEAARQVPPLTSADSFPRTVGAKAAASLLERIERGEGRAETVLVEPELIPRDSTLLWKTGRRTADRRASTGRRTTDRRASGTR